MKTKQYFRAFVDKDVRQLQPPREESFTIHLGSQLKHMHNIRIMAANVIDLCGTLHTADDSLSALNMALGLYSSSLYGIVVLTPVGRVQATDDVDKNANLSTEIHFDQVHLKLNLKTNDLVNQTSFTNV